MLTECEHIAIRRSSDEICAHYRLFFGKRDACGASRLDGTKQPRHILTESIHGLHALEILFCLIGVAAVDLIPILRGNYRHAGDGEIFVELIKRSRGTASAAGNDGGTGFECKRCTSGIEGTVEKCGGSAGCRCVVYGASDNDPVRILCEFNKIVYRIVYDAFATVFATSAASATSGKSVGPAPEYFIIDALLVQGASDLAKRGIGASLSVRAAVEH